MTALAGTSRLVRFTLRRDRVRLTVWVVAITIVVLGSVASFSTTYPTAADRQARAEVLEGSAAAALFVGPDFGADNYTFGAMAANEMLPLTTLAFALMSIFLVVRHTRREEESVRAELVRSAMVGRCAAATAALVEVSIASLVLCALLTGGLPASLEGLGAEGSLAFAAACAGTAFVFAGVALVTAQLTVSARAALGLASTAMGALYVLRAIGDIGGGGLSWLSPFGWATNMRAYVDERWWPLALFAVLAAALVAVALRIAARRDLGEGIIRERGARHDGSERLRSPFALALRLQRTSLAAWAVSLLALGAVYGSIATEASSLSEDVGALRDYYAQVGAGAAVDQFLSLTLFMSAVIATGYVIQAATRLRAEETGLRAEALLATPVGRGRWLLAQLAVACGGGVVLLLAIGVGFGGAYATSADDASELPQLIGAALVYAPATWIFGAVTTLLFGLIPRATSWTWAVFGAFAFVALLGPLLRLPPWAHELSPFEHTPQLPADAFSLPPLLVLTAIAAALAAAGLIGLRRRDIAGA